MLNINKLFLIFIFVILFCLNIFSQPKKTSNISGKIVNVKNNKPISFANIGIIGTNIGTTSDDNGVFKINNIPVGFYQLSASFIGFENYTTESFQIINAKTFFIEIKMRESNVELSEVKIKANTLKRNNKAPVSMKSIGIQEIENIPGANRDIAKVIQNLPGVANVPALNRNDIFVRGGAGNESKFYLDGIEIPNINHFATQGSTGGTNGILNADLLREAKFYSAAFPAAKANALSGVFVFKQKDGNKEKAKFRASIGASEMSFVADGPIGDKTTYIASVRRSYLQLLFKLIKLPFLPTFNDYQVKIKHKINAKNEISLISIGALDNNRLYLEMKNPNEFQRYLLDYLPEQKQWSYAVGIVWKHFYKNGYSTLVASRNKLMNQSYKYLDNKKENGFLQDYKSTEAENKLRWENTFYLANDFDINAGIDLQQVNFTNNIFRKLFTFNNTTDAKLNSNLDLYKYSVFVQLDKAFFRKKLRTSFGYRMLGNSYNKQMNNPLKQNSLQAKISYSISPKISANIHAGRFYQLPPYIALGYKDNNGIMVNKQNKLTYIQADHLVGGIEFYPFSQGVISLEGFYKKYKNYPFSIKDNISLAHRTIDFGTIGNEEISSTSEGRAYGVEFLSQNRFAHKFNLLMSYTFAVSEFLNKNKNWTPTAWDNRHIFIITLTKEFKHYWDVGLKWRFAGGLPYSPYDLEGSSNKIAWNIRKRAYIDYNKLMNNRLKPFHQLDLRVDKSFFIKNTELRIYFDVQNIYNFKSEAVDLYTNRDENGKIMINENDNTKYNLRPLENEGSGTVLPTIGIIFDF